jgi:hypothetical protein
MDLVGETIFSVAEQIDVAIKGGMNHFLAPHQLFP